jgi:hypothetical protein
MSDVRGRDKVREEVMRRLLVKEERDISIKILKSSSFKLVASLPSPSGNSPVGVQF